MINKIKEIVRSILDEEKQKTKDSLIFIDPGDLVAVPATPNLIGLFCEVVDEKVAELVHALLCLNESNQSLPEEKRKPIEFYISTYGGSADDMFSLYDIMRMVKRDCDIETIGMGKIMSAGTLILASGTKGRRKIMKNCRVMIHSVSAGNLGTIHNLENELEEIQHLQDMYVNALAEETHMTKRQIRKLLDQKVNVYLTAAEAVEYGLADEVI